jgi:hypothetical protein
MLLFAQIPRIDSDFVHAAVNGLKGKTVIEVNVGDEGSVRPLSDFAESFCGIPRRDSETDYLAPFLKQLINLAQNRVNVVGGDLCHGLNRDRCTVADENLPHLHLATSSPDNFGLHFFHRIGHFSLHQAVGPHRGTQTVLKLLMRVAAQSWHPAVGGTRDQLHGQDAHATSAAVVSRPLHTPPPHDDGGP